jgi:hypothetical protein
MTTSSSNIKGLPDSNNDISILKSSIRVSDTMVVVIHESIVRKLRIDERQTLFEEIPTSERIFLRVSRCSDSLALPKTGKEN